MHHASDIRRVYFFGLILLNGLTFLSGCGNRGASRDKRPDRIIEPRPGPQIPCPEGAVDQEEFQSRLNEFTNQYGIDIQFSPDYDAVHEVQFSVIPEDRMLAADFYLKTIEKEIQRHAREFLRTADTKTFGFVQNATVSGDPVSGLALFDERHLLFSIDSDSCSEESLAGTFHHELFHMYHWVPDPPSFDVTRWSALNDKSFRYGASKEVDTDMNHPLPGFVNHYATSDETEDSSETFTAMMLTSHAVKLKGWLPGDRVLASKARFLKDLLVKVSPDYSDEYWTGIENGQDQK